MERTLMSSIPTNAMPHAAPAAEAEAEEGETMTLARRATEQAGRLAGLARDNPRTAIAAGAAVAAGVAAAAIPLVRAARRKSDGAAAPKSDTGAAKPQARKRAPARKTAKKS
jgi:hypothetical protein